MPTFYFIKEGKVITNIRGADVAGIQRLVAQHGKEAAAAPKPSAPSSAAHAHAVTLPQSDAELHAALSKRNVAVPAGAARADLVRLFVGALSAGELKDTLLRDGVDVRGCLEKDDYREKLRQVMGV